MGEIDIPYIALAVLMMVIFKYQIINPKKLQYVISQVAHSEISYHELILPKFHFTS